jgi:glycosyltransferase involved in cell wall biosynthesis
MERGQITGALAVLMPAYNEEATLEIILHHVLTRPEVGQVIAVDDGSTDRTWAILQAAAARDKRVTAVRQETNAGKGAALRRAISEIRRPFAIVQDADLEYDPRDYPALLAPLMEGRADAVYGVRGFASHSSYSFWFVVGNKLVNLMANLLFDCYISDVETGYKVIRTELWKELGLTGNRFDIEPEITARLLRLGYRIHEVPIRYYARSREQGKKLTWRDGVHALATLLRLRMAPEASLFGPGFDRSRHSDRQRELATIHPLIEISSEPGASADR